MEFMMKKYLEQLQSNILFKNFDFNDLESILNCLSAKVHTYKKDDILLFQGDEVHFIGIVLSGRIKIIKEDISGNINIVSNFGINAIFAEAFAYANVFESPVTVQASEYCEILYIDSKRLFRTCKNTCVFHTSLIENMLSLIARKNIMLNEKIEILSKRTTREKLLEFFNIQIHMTHSKKFSIPYNREGLANYLCVDRSALSRELSNMRDEGLIDFQKNRFEVLYTS
jgi:CRP-like cAMP-binding protein